MFRALSSLTVASAFSALALLFAASSAQAGGHSGGHAASHVQNHSQLAHKSTLKATGTPEKFAHLPQSSHQNKFAPKKLTTNKKFGKKLSGKKVTKSLKDNKLGKWKKKPHFFLGFGVFEFDYGCDTYLARDYDYDTAYGIACLSTIGPSSADAIADSDEVAEDNNAEEDPADATADDNTADDDVSDMAAPKTAKSHAKNTAKNALQAEDEDDSASDDDDATADEMDAPVVKKVAPVIKKVAPVIKKSAPKKVLPSAVAVAPKALDTASVGSSVLVKRTRAVKSAKPVVTQTADTDADDRSESDSE